MTLEEIQKFQLQQFEYLQSKGYLFYDAALDSIFSTSVINQIILKSYSQNNVSGFNNIYVLHPKIEAEFIKKNKVFFNQYKHQRELAVEKNQIKTKEEFLSLFSKINPKIQQPILWNTYSTNDSINFFVEYIKKIPQNEINNLFKKIDYILNYTYINKTTLINEYPTKNIYEKLFRNYPTQETINTENLMASLLQNFGSNQFLNFLSQMTHLHSVAKTNFLPITDFLKKNGFNKVEFFEFFNDIVCNKKSTSKNISLRASINNVFSNNSDEFLKLSKNFTFLNEDLTPTLSGSDLTAKIFGNDFNKKSASFVLNKKINYYQIFDTYCFANWSQYRYKNLLEYIIKNLSSVFNIDHTIINHIENKKESQLEFMIAHNSPELTDELFEKILFKCLTFIENKTDNEKRDFNQPIADLELPIVLNEAVISSSLSLKTKVDSELINKNTSTPKKIHKI